MKVNGKINSAKIARLVDKRKHMERNLSQSQRDKVLLQTAKDDVDTKKSLLEAFVKSNETFQVSMTKMADFLNSLGGGIAFTVQMVASQQQPYQPY